MRRVRTGFSRGVKEIETTDEHRKPSPNLSHGERNPIKPLTRSHRGRGKKNPLILGLRSTPVVEGRVRSFAQTAPVTARQDCFAVKNHDY
jgi:hypothetical protein